MKLTISYWTKREIYCPACKSDRIVLIFFKHDNISKILDAIDEELIKWLDQQIKKKRFANRSHGFEFAVTQLKDKS